MNRLYKITLDPPLRDLRNRRGFSKIEVVARSKREAKKRLYKVSNPWDNRIAAGQIVQIEEARMPKPQID